MSGRDSLKPAQQHLEPPVDPVHIVSRDPHSAHRRGARMRSAWLRGNGAQGRDRTADTAIFSHMLYQLSYLGPRIGPAERREARALPNRRLRRCPARRGSAGGPGNAIAFAEPFQQVAVLAAAAAEGRVVGRGGLPHSGQFGLGSARHGRRTWRARGRRASRPRRRPGGPARRAIGMRSSAAMTAGCAASAIGAGLARGAAQQGARLERGAVGGQLEQARRGGAGGRSGGSRSR